jgi:hypothetical protein
MAPPGTVVLRRHWQYQLKRSGERRSRCCCGGSPRAAPILHKVASTYSSCVEQPIQRLFFALAAANNMKDRFGTVLGRHLVLPVLHALQGHPESGRLWETIIKAIILHPTVAFKSTTHDRTIYRGTFKNEDVLLPCVDFALSCTRESTAKAAFEVTCQ